MRAGFRALRRFSAALTIVSALALVPACQQQQQAPADETGPTSPSDEQREAQMAAQQLAVLGGPATPETRALYQGDFLASGSLDAQSGEGAWELRLLDEYAQLRRPGLDEVGGPTGPRDFHEKGVRVVAGPVTITLQAEACTTANGLALDYTAHVLFEGVAYEGCARRGADSSDQSSWATVLPELIPAIDACLARASAKPARVTIASIRDEGQVSVRLREADGDRRECIAAADGSGVSAYESISDIDRQNGEGDPEFLRGGSAPAARQCRTVTEAKSATGASLGWLVSRSC